MIRGLSGLLILLVCASSLFAGTGPAEKEKAKPDSRSNVLLLIADDQGYGEFGPRPGNDAPTPHIDALAASGVRFTAAYVTAPACSPSRAGLITGRYQQRFGHENNIGIQPELGLPLTEKTMADRFRAAGYATGWIGKWHLGMGEPYQAPSRGFDEFFGFLHGSRPYFVHRRWWAERDPIRRGREPVYEKEYLTDAFGREAAAFVARHGEKPWLLVVSFSAVHVPLVAKPEDLERFGEIDDRQRRIYAAMQHAMDRAVGLVLKTVEDAGLAKRTLVFYLSDNGAPTAQTSSKNAPLRGNKSTLCEGGIRVPFAVRWDGKIPAGRVIGHPVSALDILPTALAAAGIEPGKDAGLDGTDLLPLLTGATKDAPHAALFWRMGERSAVRAGNLKLLVDGKGTRLFDVEADVGEMKDLAERRPEDVGRLRKLYEEWEKGTIPAKWSAGSRPGGRR
ncbi:MAG: sulfatase-like hydrolase/transferase, partial [Planctomycetota bacterium]